MTEKYFAEESAAFMRALDGLPGNRVAILGHVRPDGDCIGSQVALARILRERGVDAVCYNHHRVPPNCAAFVQDTPFFVDEDGVEPDRIAISVDCADRKRLGPVLQEAYPEVYLNIDHHISNKLYGKENLIIGTASATGEILAGFFLDNGLPVDAAAAQALYVGIATDTGQFRFSSTTQKTFAICHELMEYGADPAAAALELYEKESPAKLALLQHFLASFRFLCDGKVCIGSLDNKAWRETGASKEDTEGLVDYARAIDGVEIGVLLEEREDSMKGSFRAKDPIHRVDQLAARFNGGGHACAAGFNPEMDLKTFYPLLEEALKQHFATLNQGVS